MKISERIKKLFANKNFVRAAVIYGSSLLIGVIGFVVGRWVIGGKFGEEFGWWLITCVPGFGTGVGLALLNNGHKKPVTLGSVASTVAMTLLLAAIMWFLKAPLLSLVVGWVLNMVGAALALWFCRWEAGATAAPDTQEQGNAMCYVPDKGKEEIIDIFDENMNKIGEMEKAEAHAKKQWHKNAHMWVTDGKRVLMQKRAACKKDFPNKWALSVGGHFAVGETPLECAKREWVEEFGLPWEFGDVEPDIMEARGMWENKAVYEFIYFFFLKGKPDISKVVLQETEVADLKWIPWDEFKKLIKTDDFCAVGDEYWGIVIDGLGKLQD